jgi:hypothetical protein
MVKMVEEIKPGEVISSKTIKKVSEKIEMIEDINFLNQFDLVIEKSRALQSLLSDQLSSDQLSSGQLSNGDAKINSSQKMVLTGLCNEIKALAVPYDSHLKYSLRKGVTCQTFSALAILFLMRMNGDNSSFDSLKSATQAIGQVETSLLEKVIALSEPLCHDSTLHSSDQIFAMGFLKSSSAVNIAHELKSKGMRTEPPMYIQAALGLLPVE